VALAGACACRHTSAQRRCGSLSFILSRIGAGADTALAAVYDARVAAAHVGDGLLAPAALWPSECCTEHGGLGWSVRVSAHVGSAAVRVALVHARTMAGASSSPALVRLAALLAPLSILRATPALGGTPAHLMPGRGGDGSGARALVRVPAAVSAADTPEPAPLPPGLSRGAHKASLPR
jgi:hypothetical protein